MAKKKEYKRLQFKFSAEAVEQLDELVELTEAATRAEVVRNALRLYAYTVKKLKSGYTFEFKKDGEDLTVIFNELMGIFG